MINHLKIVVFSLLFLCCSCKPSSLQDFQKEGEKIQQRLIEVLENIQTHQDLVDSQNELTSCFNHLADTMILARKYLDYHRIEKPITLTSRQQLLNRRLQKQLARVSCIREGREILMKTQEEALRRLNRLEKR